MKKTFLESGCVISPMGWNTRETLDAMCAGQGGIGISSDRGLSDTDLPLALLDWKEMTRRVAALDPGTEFTRFEQLAILSVTEAIRQSSVDPSAPGTVLILSTTKGNVELLQDPGGFDRDRLNLWKSARVIADFLGMNSKPVVISNACISGLVALLAARQLIQGGRFEHAIVVGADVLSRFIVSGFQSFLSLSEQPCRPFDENRDGLTLGEAASTVVVSGTYGDVELAGGSVSNDANHISGPSRTGEGLYLAITRTLEGRERPDLISAHGTATLYNDEMESIAFTRAGLGKVPVNSLKGYFGHTLGAAGLLESLLNIEAMRRGILLSTRGFERSGVSREIDVVRELREQSVATLLKTASGFGGCNAAALFRVRG
jgi:3-oxoacyl-[acyl-carrier-protein] synthase-1